MPKQIIVSNRLPISPVKTGKRWDFRPNAGGLTSSLSGVREGLAFDWIGWAGADIEEGDRAGVAALIREKHRCHPVFLSGSQIDRFYNGFCNSVLWPLFHYAPTRVDFSLPYWDEYRKVNEMFAEVVLSICDDDDLVWVHDFHLFLLPRLLRRERPRLRIGFFLHIPFPSSEIYRLLPVRKELLAGILGSDLIGFQTPDYGRHFAASCLRVLGLVADVTDIPYEGRRVTYGSYPIGINPEMFLDAIAGPDTGEYRSKLNSAYEDRKVLLGVDRIDYSKGLLQKMDAYERFLEKYPHWRGKVVLLQMAIPSRLHVPEYRRLKNDLDRVVGHINGRFGTTDYTPIQYVAHDARFEELCALYERADACLVTSIRDGMNLVALEYSVCQRERHGVLVLSEFCGAANSLGSAINVNPWDRDGLADAIELALTMSHDERARRALDNFQSVMNSSSKTWARTFLRDLEQGGSTASHPAEDLRNRYFMLRRQYRQAPERLILLDYDGTVVNFTEDPAAAKPSPELLDVIRALSGDSRNTIYFISGRSASQLERWFDGLPVGLAAEHGMFVRWNGDQEWRQRETPPLDWMQDVLDILEDFHRRTPGSRVEQKRTGIAWHYRGVETSFGERQSLELVSHLQGTLARVPVSIIQGHRVIEVRPQTINKGKLVTEILEVRGDPGFVLCLGDDRTDEDMFAALPPTAWTCRIGERVTHARFYLPAPEQVLEMLSDLAQIED